MKNLIFNSGFFNSFFNQTMHIVSTRFLLFSWSLSLIQCTNEDKKADSTTTDTRNNVPVIRASSSSEIFFEEQFQDRNKWVYWTKSQAKKDGVEERVSKYDGQWAFEISESSVYKDDYSLILKVIDRRSLVFFVLHVRLFSRKNDIMRLVFI